MKTKLLAITSLLFAALSFSPALLAGNGPGPGAGRGQCVYGSPENCPNYQAGTCPGPQMRGQGNGNHGANNPNRAPKRDGTGGPGKPANPTGPQDGSGPGPRR
jgi:hypothetical protein